MSRASSSCLRIFLHLGKNLAASFLGDKVCRNPDWLRITVNYTIDSLMAAAELRLWPEMPRVLGRSATSCQSEGRSQLCWTGVASEALTGIVRPLVAQLSSRVFLGDKVCRNPDWLRITVNYTIDSLMAAAEPERNIVPI
jgi:hypothetical protein